LRFLHVFPGEVCGEGWEPTSRVALWEFLMGIDESTEESGLSRQIESEK
jgi:hypothetical protein